MVTLKEIETKNQTQKKWSQFKNVSKKTLQSVKETRENTLTLQVTCRTLLHLDSLQRK